MQWNKAEMINTVDREIFIVKIFRRQPFPTKTEIFCVIYVDLHQFWSLKSSLHLATKINKRNILPAKIIILPYWSRERVIIISHPTNFTLNDIATVHDVEDKHLSTLGGIYGKIESNCWNLALLSHCWNQGIKLYNSNSNMQHCHATHQSFTSIIKITQLAK